MWIKRSLMIVPACLLVFLAQSFFWAPSNDSAADNEGRQNRIIFYMGGDPSDMNPWSSSTTTDSTITQYLYEGLLRYNREYLIEPWLSEYVTINHQLEVPVPPGLDLTQFKSSLKERYGKALAECEKISDGDNEPKYFDYTSGEPASGPADNTVAFTKPTMVRVLLKAEVQQGAITSAVDPDFGEKFYGENMVKFLIAQEGVPEGAITPAVAEKLADKVGLPSISHKPIVEMRVRPGVFWTDGPFFTAANRTWQVFLNGDMVGSVEADSATAAESQVRERHKAKETDKVQARPYDKRFGDEEAGPWWGRGPEMTARDPKLTFDLIRNPDFGSPRLSSWSDVEEIRLVDDDKYKLEVVYGKLYSPALSNLVGDIIPYHVWNQAAWKEEAIRKERSAEDLGIDPEDYNVMRALPVAERDFRHRPSSSGPMVLEPLNGEARPLWKSAEIATLRRNEFYWERQPEFEFIDYLIFDPNMGRETSEIAFLSGNMDIYTARDFQVERYKGMSDDYYVLERETTTYEYLGFNCRTGPLANKRVRLALSMAIDVEEIMKYVVYEQGQRISGPAYPVLPWFNRGYKREYTWLTDTKDAAGNVTHRKGKTEKLDFIPYDVNEGLAILKEEGYTLDSSGTLVKDGKPFAIRLVNGASGGGGPRTDIALLARSNWQKMGVRVEYEEYEWNVFIGQYVFPGNFDVVVLGWSGGLNFDKRQLFHSKYMPPRGLNFVGYENPKSDELMEQILDVYDPEEQVRLSHEIFASIADDCPYVWLYSPYSTSVMDRRIVWRKEVGKNSDGSLKLENRPVNNQYITGAKASLSFFVNEFKRLDEAPEFTDEDRKR